MSALVQERMQALGLKPAHGGSSKYMNLFATHSQYTGPTSPPPFPGRLVREATHGLLNFPLLPSAQKFQKSVTVHPEYFQLIVIINQLS
jgi:hypothetical protein